MPVTQIHHLPGPTAELWEWQLHGACRGHDSSVFYHPDGERGRSRAQREARAKAICQTCPVINNCLEHALDSAEVYGVWGGMSESERSLELRARRRAKAAQAAKTAQTAKATQTAKTTKTTRAARATKAGKQAKSA